MERRDFIKNCSALCATGIGLGFILQSCDSIHYAVSSLDSNKIIINKTEFIDKKNKERKFIVVKQENLKFPICVYKTTSGYTALYMECTHQGCELQPNIVSLICPCHGSEFSTNGKVQSPPADRDLRQFRVINDNDKIYIEI